MLKPSEALVWIEADGSARELTERQKKHVDAEYSPFDGARPFIKTSYEQVNALGDRSGYVARTALPAGIVVGPAPAEKASPMTPAEAAADILDRIARFRKV
jgi:hypothetical protein